MSSASTCRRLTIAVAATIATVAATAGSALASAPVAGCPAATITNPFTQWGDGADYQLAPGGDVEDSGASWSLSGGAGVAEGNEPFMVTSPTDHLSLRLPAVSTATTRRMCIGAEHDSFRFFAKRTGGTSASRMLVEVVYADASGRQHVTPVGLVQGSGAWAPSPSLPTIANLLAPATTNAIDVAFRFRPQGNGSWSVDDVYVDPMRGI